MRRAFLLLILLALPARAGVSVTGPAVGYSAPNFIWKVEQAAPGSSAAIVYILDYQSVPVEATGLFYFRGVSYATGYRFAAAENLYAKNHGL